MKHKHGEEERDDRVKQDSTFMGDKGCRESDNKEHIGDQAFRAFTHLGATQSGCSLHSHKISVQPIAAIGN
jgi:hypothetical protein